MAINFTGEFTTPRCVDDVFDFLSDPNKFAALFPDFEGISFQDPTHFTVKLLVALGNLRGNAELKMELAEATRPQRALYKGTGIAVGSQIDISAGFDLSPSPEGTKVAWQGEAGVSGKLATMSGMLEPVVKKNIQKLIDGLRWALYIPALRAETEVAPAEAVHGASDEATAPVVTPPVADQAGPLAPAEAPPQPSRFGEDV